MSRRRFHLQRGMTLIEVMVVGVAAVALAAASGSTLVDQARRSRAVDATRNTLLPHTVARDRAVAARTCVEPVLLPPLSQDFFDLDGDLPAIVLNGRRNNPRIAVIQWSDCTGDALVAKVDFYDLDGSIEFDAYSSADGRMVFDFDGALTSIRPGVPDSLPSGGALVCPAPGAGGGGDDDDEAGPDTAPGEPAPPPKGPPAGCTPSKRLRPPVPDITFTARTFFGTEQVYKTWSRMGATEPQ